MGITINRELLNEPTSPWVRGDGKTFKMLVRAIELSQSENIPGVVFVFPQLLLIRGCFARSPSGCKTVEGPLAFARRPLLDGGKAVCFRRVGFFFTRAVLPWRAVSCCLFYSSDAADEPRVVVMAPVRLTHQQTT